MTFGEYQEQAHSFSRLHEFENPAEVAGNWALSEMLEIWFETKNGTTDATRTAVLNRWQETDAEISLEIAKEFGDLLWFISEDTTSHGKSLDKVAKDSLYRNAGITTNMSRVPVDRFDETALSKAGKFSVNNFKMIQFLQPGQVRLMVTSLEDSPGYVLGRVLGRLRRALSPAFREQAAKIGPPGNADFESELTIQRSRADSLWVMSWIGQTMLNTSLEEIADMNLQKLNRREAAGTILSGHDVDRSK